jgi:hypothetical protein
MLKVTLEELFNTLAEKYMAARMAADTFGVLWANSCIKPSSGERVDLNLRLKAAMTADAGDLLDKGQAGMSIDADMMAAEKTLLGENPALSVYKRDLSIDRARADRAIRRHCPRLA